MLIESTFIRGVGSLRVDNAGFTDEWFPALFGMVTLDFADHWGNRRVTTRITAKVMDGTSLYELTIGPLKGRMYKNPAKLDDADADFFGLIGSLDEIRVWGWKRTSEKGERYIEIDFQSANKNNLVESNEMYNDPIFEF
ncbi:MAG: hypothetical protein O9341_06485 [Paucibacter sp.]|nr:hypothetical protein [Roseateles sp.]